MNAKQIAAHARKCDRLRIEEDRQRASHQAYIWRVEGDGRIARDQGIANNPYALSEAEERAAWLRGWLTE